MMSIYQKQIKLDEVNAKFRPEHISDKELL